MAVGMQLPLSLAIPWNEEPTDICQFLFLYAVPQLGAFVSDS